MIVYKFGGASVANAEKVKNVASIIQKADKKPVVVVISAMGKTTNALEALLDASRNDRDFETQFDHLISMHNEILNDLFESESNSGFLDELFIELKGKFDELKHEPYDFAYDQVVSYGEIISTKIVEAYLKHTGVNSIWLDARKLIFTDDTYREGIVKWKKTEEAVRNTIMNSDHFDVIITQGFIGADPAGNTTTLGREGSDYTAAILSFCLDSNYMAIWKDVPGILTADPKLFDNVTKIDRLSYKEAIEMTYYGAKVIHPKTIKPIQNKNIPLLVKSFLEPSGDGTLISGEIELTYPPVIVIEPNQALIHISTKDFSFVGEHHLSKLFDLFNKHRVRVNMMRNTAISFSVCTQDIKSRIDALMKDLDDEFNIVVDHNLELITIRHYTEELVTRMKEGKIILFEERLQQTIQIVVKDIPNMIRRKVD